MRMTLSDWTLLVLRTGIAALALLAVLRIRDGMGPFATGMAIPYLRYGIFEQSMCPSASCSGHRT